VIRADGHGARQQPR